MVGYVRPLVVLIVLIPTTVIQPLHVQASIKVRTRTGNITELTSRRMR